MSKKPALGRGLSALLENAAQQQTKSKTPAAKSTQPEPVSHEIGHVAGPVSVLSISQIEANPFQPRQEFDKSAMRELAQSIQELGLIQPITVRKISAQKYQIISG